MAEETWQNHGIAIYKKEKGLDPKAHGKAPLLRSTSFTTGAIQKASVQWYKMKWQFTGSANNTWGEEVQGYAVIKPALPVEFDSPVFQPEKVNQIQMRMFNLSRGDDASNDIRCAFLKFGGGNEEGPLDLAFSTGSVSCFSSVASLQAFLGALDEDEDALQEWAITHQDNCYALIDGVRRFPKCRTDMDYYNHGTFAISTASGRKLARLRLLGNDDVSSRLTEPEQSEAWVLRRPDMELPSDTYLRDELAKIATSHKTMKLQIQIRDFQPGNESVCNPRRAWDDKDFPWQDLADLTLTYHVPKEPEERAHFNFTKLPDNFSMETPHGTDNFGGLVMIQEKVLASNVRKKHVEGKAPENVKTTTYLVHVETGNHMFSGTDAGVYIALYGTKGRTKKYLLDKLFHNDFERGSKESYYITVPVIGDVKFVQVFLIGGKYTFSRSWFLSNIVLMDLTTRKLFEMPCYRWIDDNIILPTGEAMLASKESHVDRKYLRHVYLEEHQALFKWREEAGMPSYIDSSSYNDLPQALKYSSERQLEKKKVLADVMLKLKLHKYVTVFSSFDSFEDFKNMALVVPQTETSRAILERWQLDEEFGRQYLSGVNPVLIQRCNGPMTSFPVTNELVGNLLDRGMSLEDEMKAGHIYYVHYKHLAGVQRREGDKPRFVATAYAMLYVRQDGQLVPIAIQLDQEPGPNTPIWTPNDNELDWLLAKIYVKSADSHYQTIWCHLTQAHFIMEVFTVAMYRQLPQNHPVFKLLIQNTRFTVAGAQMGRDLLLNGTESVFQKILSVPGHERDFIKNCFADFKLADLIPPKSFSEKGVDDVKALPNYCYRDDSLLSWYKIADMVKDVLSVFYLNDQDVADDKEIDAFAREIRETGFKKQRETDTPNGVPASLNTLDELVEFVSLIIFNSSCYHAAMNYGQVDYFAFAPNYPSALRRAPPTVKGQTTEEVIMDTLPNKADQAVAVAFSYYLSEPLSDEVYLGDFVDVQFTETRVREILDRFSDDMVQISRQIKERNTDLEIPYIYLLPEAVPKAAGQ